MRDFFREMGVLVSRPAPDSACRIGVSIKAGGNANHSHDDVGAFAIALGREQLVADPGGPDAYQKDMSKFKSRNSFGHPVPLIAGALQIDTPEGLDVVSEVIEENGPPFTRVGIRLKRPLSKGTVTMEFAPAKGQGAAWASPDTRTQNPN